MNHHPDDMGSVLGSGSSSLTDEDVRSSNFQAARGLSELVRSTLGPRGMDKMIVGNGKVVVTNNGASILDRAEVDHPTANLIVNVSRSQEKNVFDGTTTAVILTAELIEQAEGLLDEGVHPTDVIAGYERASKLARESLKDYAVEVDDDRLVDLARTAITGKWEDDVATHLAELAVEAARTAFRDDRVWRQNISLKIRSAGEPRDSALYEGLVIDLGSSSTSFTEGTVDFPTRIENANVALIDDEFTIEKPRAVSHVSPTDAGQMEQFRHYEADEYRSKVDLLDQLGTDVVFCQKSIDDDAMRLLAQRGIFSVERTRQDEMFKLSRATGATLVHSIDEFQPTDVGRTTLLDHRTLGGVEFLFLTDNSWSDQITLLVRGGTEHVAEETKRVIKDCLNVAILALEGGRIVPGGGTTEVGLARKLRSHAEGVQGREQLAVKAFANALEIVPWTLAESAGRDPIDVLVELRRRHADSKDHTGFDATGGVVTEAAAAGILDLLVVKEHALASATTAAAQILRIDDVISVSGSLGMDEDDHDHEHQGPGGLKSDPHGYPWTIGH